MRLDDRVFKIAHLLSIVTCPPGASLEWRDDCDGQGMTSLHIAVRIVTICPRMRIASVCRTFTESEVLSPLSCQVCSDAPEDKKAAVLDWLISQNARKTVTKFHSL